MPKALLLGGTGVIGRFLVPELVNRGFDVYVTSRSPRDSTDPRITYIQGNARNQAFIKKITKDRYDVIVDFMIYTTDEFKNCYELYLQSADQYIFLSTFRVFADSGESPVTEKTPRLLDVSDDQDFLKTDFYPLTKARQEDILRDSSYKNWTIARATITYWKKRFHFCKIGSPTLIYRSLVKCPVVLPDELLSKKATMTYGGDSAKMISWLVLNPAALCEDFNICTDEHHTWEEIGTYYKELIGMEYVKTDLDTYIKVIGNKYSIIYDRMYDRVFKNSKIMSASDRSYQFLPVYDRLKEELSEYPDMMKYCKINYLLNAKIDQATNTHIPMENAGIKQRLLYWAGLHGLDGTFNNIYNRLGLNDYGKHEFLKKVYMRFFG